MEAVVLAGGLGTRLGAITNSIPKPMVDIAGKPFLAYVLRYLSSQGVTKVVLAVSYKWQVIREFFGDSYAGLELRYSIEQEPLGTGGGVRQALAWTKSDDIVVVNGDTFFQVQIQDILVHHQSKRRQVTLSLKPMRDFSRYGAVKLQNGQVTGFEEKGHRQSGYINGGVMIMKSDVFDQYSLQGPFSLEEDLLMALLRKLNVGGVVSDGYFIDIGLPEDLQRARRELPGFFPDTDDLQSGDGTS